MLLNLFHNNILQSNKYTSLNATLLIHNITKSEFLKYEITLAVADLPETAEKIILTKFQVLFRR